MTSLATTKTPIAQPVCSPSLQKNETDLSRPELTSILQQSPYLDPKNDTFKHGRLFHGDEIPPPACIWRSGEKPREDHDVDSWLTASEYRDTDAALLTKIKILANLIRVSNKTGTFLLL